MLSSAILGLGDALPDPRLLLASAASNITLDNLFERVQYRIWGQWVMTGPPDDVEDVPSSDPPDDVDGELSSAPPEDEDDKLSLDPVRVKIAAKPMG